MSLQVAILLLFAGFIVLAGGGELLVRGAIRLARRLRISQVVIGLTVVALATSLPELAVSLTAALRGNTDLAAGNIVGSNMFNIAVIIGLTAVLFPPLLFRAPKLRFDISVMIGSSGLLMVLGWDNLISPLDGLVFLVGLVIFLWIRVHNSRSQDVTSESDDSGTESDAAGDGNTTGEILVPVVFILAGAGLLTGGAHLLIQGATTIARYAGVSERVIAITLVSAGTGLPELTTAIVAGFRRHFSVAIGNVIGSNIFNVLGILGTVSLVRQIPASQQIIHEDAIWMLGFSLVLLLPVFKPNRKFTRLEGVILLAVYGYYVYTLF